MESKISSFSIARTVSESQRILFTTDKPNYRKLNLKKKRKELWKAFIYSKKRYTKIYAKSRVKNQRI